MELLVPDDPGLLKRAQAVLTAPDRLGRHLHPTRP
jgi:hypothetical protein